MQFLLMTTLGLVVLLWKTVISDAHGFLWLTEGRSIITILINNALNSSGRIQAASCRQVAGIGKSINYLHNVNAAELTRGAQLKAHFLKITKTG